MAMSAVWPTTAPRTSPTPPSLNLAEMMASMANVGSDERARATTDYAGAKLVYDRDDQALTRVRIADAVARAFDTPIPVR